MISAFVLGLMGSWHCAVMCGGFAWGPKPWAYLWGRLLGYVSLGALLGWAGQGLMQFLGSPLLLGGCGSLLVGMGLARQRPLKANNGFSLVAFIWTELGPRLRNPSFSSRLGLGLVTALFPCGLLSAAWMQAANAGGAGGAALCMASFWLGSLPGLLLPAWLGRKWGVGLPLDRIAMVLTGSWMLAQALLPGSSPQGSFHCL